MGNELIEQYSRNNKTTRIRNLKEQEDYEKLQHNLKNRNKIFDVWKNIQKSNTDLRSDYAKKLFWLLVGQLIFLDVIVLISMIFSDDMEFKKILVLGVGAKCFIEIIGFVAIIIKYLFNPINDEMKSILKELNIKNKK